MSLPTCAILAATLFLAVADNAMAGSPVDGLAKFSSAELRAHDERQEMLLAELAALPPAPDDQSSPRTGWHSNFTTGPRSTETAESVTLDFGSSEAFDSIAMVPVNVAYGAHPGPGYGFPVRFRIEGSQDSDFVSPILLGDFSAADFPNPGNLPVVVRTPGAKARCVRVTATRLFSRGNDALFALGELMVWRGQVNIATGVKCRTSSNYENAPAWQPDNLTDGQSVLGPPLLITTTPGNGYHSKEHQPEFSEKWVQLDLEKPLPLEEIRVFAARPRDFPVRSGFGFPLRFRIEASDDANFATPISIVEFKDQDCVNPGDNPFVVSARGITARHVRFTATRLWARHNDFVFALSEMQIFSNGQNAAIKATPSASEEINTFNWKLAFINDGFTSQGRLIDWAAWMQGLSRRRELVQEMARHDSAREPLVTAALWKVGKWSLAALAGIAGILTWWFIRQRRMRHRDLAKLRQRIAGDLHDEIGSNLGSIALLARLAGEHAGEGAQEDVAEIQRIARETSESMRDIVWLIQPGRRDAGDLPARMREIALLQLAGSECIFESEGVAGPFPLDFERQILMFFKEALNNIRKHAKARRIEIRLSQTGRTLSLLIVDDGVGFDTVQASSGHGLVSMKHRAGLLGGSLLLESAPSQGTRLELRAHLP